MSRFWQTIYLLAVLFMLPSAAHASGVSMEAYTLTDNFLGLGISITNSMITSWVVAIVVFSAIRLSIGRPQLKPNRCQVVVENIMEYIESLIEPIVGKRLAKPTFPLLLCFFIFILINNWSGLIPGMGAFGFGHGEHLLYFGRPGTADLNMTLALAIISFIAWGYYVLRYAGIKAFLYENFGNKADKKEVPAFLYYPLFIVFALVGIIECISIASRLLSLPFRLFGNVFGGENLLESMQSLLPWYVPVAVPFYFLELLIGFVQALVFTLLIAVYIGMVCNHEEEGAH